MVPDFRKQAFADRIWCNNKLVHNVILRLANLRVHFSGLTTSSFGQDETCVHPCIGHTSCHNPSPL
jgi:hypothetical protein